MKHLRNAGLALFVLACLTPPPAWAQVGKKAPVPSKEAQEKAVSLIHELFKRDLDTVGDLKDPKNNPKDPRIAAAHARLAGLFLAEARDTNDDRAGKFVLLSLAMYHATLGGEPSTALDAMEEMNLYFALPPGEVMKTKIGLLRDASRSTASNESYQSMIDSAMLFLDEALAEDDYESAKKLLATADAAARKLRNVPKVAGIRKRLEEVEGLEKQFARWKPFADKLAKNPGDADANLHMGVYQAFIKGDWDRGLPLLARGKSDILKKLALIDMGDPAATKKQLQLAEIWFELAQKNPVPSLINDKEFAKTVKVQLLLRSHHWYQDAIGLLAPGERAKVEQRMRSIEAMLPPEYAVGDISTELRRCEGHVGPVYCAAFSPDGKKIVSGGADGFLRLWDVRTGKELRHVYAASGRLWTVAFSADGRYVISGGFDGSVRLWDMSGRRAVRRFSGHTDYVRSLAASRDGKFILSSGDDRLLRLWSDNTSPEVRQFPGHEHFVWCVDLSRNGERAVSASLDKTVRLWDVATGKQLQVLRGHKDTVLSVAFTPDARRALSGSTDKTLILWDLDSGRGVQFGPHDGYVHSVAVSPDGRRAISGSQDTFVRIFDLYTLKELHKLGGIGDPKSSQLPERFVDHQVWHVAFSPDGRLALSCGQDGTVRIWGGAKHRAP